MNRAAGFAILVLVMILAVAAVPALAGPVTPAAATGATTLNTFDGTGEVVIGLPGTRLGQWSSNLRFKGEAYIDDLSLEGVVESSPHQPYQPGGMTVEMVDETDEVTGHVFSGVAIVPTDSEDVTITGSASSQDGTISGTFRAENVKLGEEFSADNLDVASSAVAVSGYFTSLTPSLAGEISGEAVTYSTNYEIASLDAVNGVAEVVGAGRLSAQEATSAVPAVQVVGEETTMSSGFGLLLLGLGGTFGCGSALYRRRR